MSLVSVYFYTSYLHEIAVNFMMSGEDEAIVVRRKKKNILGGVFGKRQSKIEPETERESGDESAKATPSKALNRLSDNFTFCCSSNPAATLSPNDLEEIPIVKPKIRPRDHLKLDLDLIQALDCSPKHIGNARVEVNLQKPITESKTRFRHKYLPRELPSNDDNSLDVESVSSFRHFSNPDITQMTSASEFSERK